MKAIDILKKILCWPLIKKFLILKEHRRVAAYCDSLIKSYYESPKKFFLKPIKDFGTSKIIWQYWGQGYNEHDIPEVVMICLDSVNKYCESDTYEIVRLSDENIKDYICFPDFVWRNKELYPPAIFSDLLRITLLNTYGGCWLDATILLTGDIPPQYWEYPYFVYQRDQSESHKKYWSNSFYYYFNWNDAFQVKMLNSIFFVRQGTPFIDDFYNILMAFWERGESLPDYFLFQILYNRLLNHGNWRNVACPIESDCIPHYLQQLINDDSFSIASIDEIFSLTSIHKLSYKTPGVVDKLKEILLKKDA